ncbi:MAG TPA: cysteine hydrolase [Dehalococcoidia bacterium]|nr:cysteine hydrolase [Dehalococcoidia bacterium]
MSSAAQLLVIPATPDPLTLDVTRTAVLVIDMQNDFGAEGGMFQRAGIDITPIQAAVAPTARVLAAARAVALPVIYLTMEFRPDLSDAGAPDSPNFLRHRRFGVGERVTAPDESESRVLVRGTWNTAILDALTPQAGDIVVAKHRYSGFYQTDLDIILKTLEARYLIVTGCTTSVCVESTIRDAMFRDYSCLLLADCTAEPLGAECSRSNHEASLLTIQALFGWVSTSTELLARLPVPRATGSGTA